MRESLQVEKFEKMSDGQLLALRNCLDTVISARDGLVGQPDFTMASGSQACRFFTVPDGVRRLDKHQVEQLTRAFEEWVGESRDARTLRSRERVFITFLVLRYTGARLGEVQSLDETRDIDFQHCFVRLPLGTGVHGKSGVREVPIPAEVMARISEWCERNASAKSNRNSRETLFHFDQGFLRRKFHEQEKRSGLPRELLNPSGLRNSRAIELMQGGMPMRAVQALLGYSKSDFISSFVTLADNDLKCVVQHYCKKEFGMETSARNTFKGQVVRVLANPVMCEIVLRTESGYEVAATVTNQSREKLGLEEGRPASALIKATWVILEKGDTKPETSARNAFPGTITKVTSDGITAEVDGSLDDGTPVCALVTAGSFEKLGIGEGDRFIFMFKAMSVIIS
ncbi:TOBE domain-containing protein [Pseudodesulfovibrio piezophilus]|uniref:TOBE domain protein n=1 Tax=Pseudodesulfovibrio piezophilus (strain DSM 21447 / JCM 15486 / C1TLV30) TaxID=1322246 RepID=M1WYA6_PSEP2|nr:TOBE domain-containing protein [Pseudodesulfovibrio piezophilus]CCH50238.1 TOBE domain protein [Pseudodesulfovibrio piezophilus C1TLV30]